MKHQFRGLVLNLAHLLLLFNTDIIRKRKWLNFTKDRLIINRVHLMNVSRSNYNRLRGDTQRSIWYNIDNDVIT